MSNDPKPVITLLKDYSKVHADWGQTFARWMSEKKQCSLDFLRTIREKCFLVHFKSLKMHCWFPTILNQIVLLNGKTFLKHPIIKCFMDDEVYFDIILHKHPPYHINRVDIDIIDKLGQEDSAKIFFNDLMELCDIWGCPLYMTDNAVVEIKSLVPCTLISLLNNKNARTHPQKHGFKGSSTIKRSTRERLAFWRFQHQDQLIHFINNRGKINQERSKELCEFLDEHLPHDLQQSVMKMTMKEYVRPPYELKRTYFSELCI